MPEWLVHSWPASNEHWNRKREEVWRGMGRMKPCSSERERAQTQACSFGKGSSRVDARTMLEIDPAGWGRACVRNKMQFTSDLITMCGFGMAQALQLSTGILKYFSWI